MVAARESVYGLISSHCPRFDQRRDEKLSLAQTGGLVAQIEFAEWTPDGHLRHSKFVGMRDDKDPRSVTREDD
jgi:ATP-dependent DNA ligase